MKVIQLVLLIIAAVLFGLAAFTTPNTRFNLVAAGLLFWVSTVIIDVVQNLDD